MKECYMCGILEDKSLLYEGIHKSRGVVNVCRKCYFKEKIPLIDKNEGNLKGINERESVRERLSKMAHIDFAKKEERRPEKRPEDMTLRDIIERNFKSEVRVSPNTPEDIVDNFNWVVMRKRRSLKITKEKFSELIKEPLIAIESLEKGILPKDYKTLIKKVEGYLEIRLFKVKDLDHHDIILESKVPSGILIEDLKKKREKDKEAYIDVSNLSLEKINEVYGIPATYEFKDEKKEHEVKKVLEKEKLKEFTKEKSKEIVKEKPKENPKEDNEEEYFKFKVPFSIKRFFSKKPSEKVKDSPRINDLKNKKELSDEDISKLVWGK
ncbi:MAG: hypothetical protein NUV46_00505 [Nanoarchaeota archaeon]|nr:hypothetical protein [Nanoarchaeota archaeon]